MAKRIREADLLKALDEHTAHADELANPLPGELTPLEKLRGSVKKYDRPTDPVWDEFFDSEGVSDDFMPDRDQPLNSERDSVSTERHDASLIVITHAEAQPFYELPYRTSGTRHPERRHLPFFRAFATGIPHGVQSLVFTSDLQGRELGGANRLLGEVVADTIRGLVKNGKIPSPDAIFACGDLYDYPDCHKRGGTGPVDEVFEALAKVAPQVVGVLGNHDVLINLEGLPSNVDILDGNVVKVAGGLKVGGVSGIIGDPNRHHRKGEEEFLTVMERVTNQKPDILLLHQGPSDPNRPERRGDSDVELSLRSGFEGLTVFGHTRWGAPWLIPLGDGQALNVDARVVVVVPNFENDELR